MPLQKEAEVRGSNPRRSTRSSKKVMEILRGSECRTANQPKFLPVSQFLDLPLPPHCFGLKIETFDVDQFPWFVQTSIFSSFPIFVKLHTELEVLRVASIDGVAFAEKHINIV
jgi:hypothetical protein